MLAEEAAAKKKQEEEAAAKKKKQEEEAAAKKKKQEEEAKQYSIGSKGDTRLRTNHEWAKETESDERYVSE
jgi:hypothetical protein